MFGTKSAKVREKLIDIGSDLTLERAIEVARVDSLRDFVQLVLILQKSTQTHSRD